MTRRVIREMNLKKKSIGILGLGWLGTALAHHLLELGHTVKGTVRSKDKIRKLQQSGIDTYYLEITENKIYGDLADFLKGTDVLFINIPPGLRKNPESDFAQRMKLLMTFVNTARVEQVIFVSSTSVFEDMEGIPVYDEHSIPNSSSNNGKKIYAAEQVVQDFFENTTILRPCGLIGSDRHPIKMLAGRVNVKNPNAPINLVTRDHVINLVKKIITDEITATVVHAISEPHDSRKLYYLKKAEEFGLVAPEFEENVIHLGKKVVSVL
ncbi:NAD(P)H-binding protein [Nonlabens sp.]|uniref:NAD(P)H-binding protein n=1 Tax=Nonlabens sp. TaxID=1888209 RepID=UPI003F6A478D